MGYSPWKNAGEYGHDVIMWSAIEKEIDSLSSTRIHPESAEYDDSSAD